MKSYAITDIGIKRAMNQDSFLCTEEPVGILPNCFIVADGMGGHNAGDIASKLVINTFVAHMKTSNERTPIQAIEEAVRASNEALIEKAREMKELDGMGTTFVLATLIDNQLLIANIGDSRLYLIKNDKIIQITRDHSLVAEMVRNGEIKKEEARFHPQKNVVLRAISTKSIVSPDFYKIKVEKDDIFLLCSDGLSDMLEESEIIKTVNEYAEVSDIAERMVVLANENGGKDNITLVLVKV